MSRFYTSADQLIGHTPLLRLTRIEESEQLPASVFAKVEYFNPTGSVKDRIAKAMIDDAEAQGVLKPGATIIEPTSGNTGIALAAVAAVKGYKAVLTMPENMSAERINLIKAYGARVVLTSAAAGMRGAVEEAERAVADAERSQADQLLDAGRKVADSGLPADADSSLEVSRLELSALQTELAAYRKVQDASGQVYPEAEGIVTRIQVSPGERVGDGAAVVYADLSSPMQFQVSLTREQKKYVNQGDAVSLKLGSASVKDLTVDYVAENEMNPELYDARVFLPDQVGTIGQSGSFEVEAQSETFSCCIPLNALYEDASHRTFVYIVSERSGILGTELAAEMVYVKVLDQNDTYAAIEEGVISRETELIVGSTEPLEDRAVIRYKEQ